ncbi:hypothetical protein J5I95_19330 [Candidatus Poribacteria bacterium]|nr:hypothetical protein [Candidatus Poribacteria bacterium]
MRDILKCFLCLFVGLSFLSCGEIEEDTQPTLSVELPDRYYDTSGLLYEITDEQVEELLNLDFPGDWYNEEDPELRAKYYHAMLIQRFGDIPAVHIDAIFYRLSLLADGKPTEVSIEDLILHAKARYLLWPNESNRKVLEDTKKQKIWRETDDPELYAELYTETLIRWHGDIPEVHIVVAGEKKKKFGGWRIATDADKNEYVEYLRAKYVLQPTEYFLCIYNVFKEARDNGTPWGVAIRKKKETCVEGGLEELLNAALEDAELNPE